MNAKEAEGRPVDVALDNLAAKLTVAAYRVALRHGVQDSWIELEIELWRSLADTLEKWQQRLPRDVTQPEALDGEPQGEAGHRREALRPRLKYALRPRPK